MHNFSIQFFFHNAESACTTGTKWVQKYVLFSCRLINFLPVCINVSCYVHQWDVCCWTPPQLPILLHALYLYIHVYWLVRTHLLSEEGIIQPIYIYHETGWRFLWPRKKLTNLCILLLNIRPQQVNFLFLIQLLTRNECGRAQNKQTQGCDACDLWKRERTRDAHQFASSA